jgi:methyl-accepting chemotaxis protein
VSANEQLAGMDQIAAAMDSVNLASSQSQAGTRQMEQAAQNLNDLAVQLTRIVEQYKLG